jgi:hypothetical protein
MWAPGRVNSPHGSHSNMKLGQHWSDTEKAGHFVRLHSLHPSLQNRSSFFAPQRCLSTKDADDDQIPVVAVADRQQRRILCKDNLKDGGVSATKYRWIANRRVEEQTSDVK